MSAIQEIAGYVNYWVDPDGKATAVRDHAPWACENILKIPVQTEFVTENVYKPMYRLGWLRVAVGGSRIMTEFFRLSPDQKWWLQNESNQRKLDVADNTGRIIFQPEQVSEVMGYVNYWLDRDGKAFACRDHIEWACKQMRVPQPVITGERSAGLFRQIYERMFDRGWARVAINPAGPLARINVEYRTLSRDQLDWLQDQSFERKLAVIDDENRTLFDSPTDVAEKLVNGLLCGEICGEYLPL